MWLWKNLAFSKADRKILPVQFNFRRPFSRVRYSHGFEELWRVDFHHHFFPAFANHLFSASYSRNVGWIFPDGVFPWSVHFSLRVMNKLGIKFSILSLTGSPSPAGEGVGEANKIFARRLNEFAAEICAKYPQRFGFFANIPIPSDVEAAKNEISYALDELGALGINLTSSYDTNSGVAYLGEPIFHPLWDELHRRQAVVFLHGAQNPRLTEQPFPSDILGLPVLSVPHETFKAAASLVLSGVMKKFPGCKIILAHCGGSAPFLAARVAMLSTYMATHYPEKYSHMKYTDVLEDFKKFYYECALSGYDSNLLAMDAFVSSDKILFGTDLPAISLEIARLNTRSIDRHYAAATDTLDSIMARNAMKLLPNLRSIF